MVFTLSSNWLARAALRRSYPARISSSGVSARVDASGCEVALGAALASGDWRNAWNSGNCARNGISIFGGLSFNTPRPRSDISYTPRFGDEISPACLRYEYAHATRFANVVCLP